MNSAPAIHGIHHITAVASSAADNLVFYRNILGLRLVKKTVNFDDPHTYHLYYGDDHGSPGTIMTFFPWQKSPAGKTGAGMVTAIALAIPREAIPFWEQRISATGQSVRQSKRFGDPVLQFSDPHGLPLELVGTDAPPTYGFRARGPIPARHAVRGFHSATATLHHLDPARSLLVEVMGLSQNGREENRYRFMTSDSASPGHIYDVVVDPESPPGQPGGGTVHHIAFRTAAIQDHAVWQSRLRQYGLSVTEVQDRQYFQSIYFTSPGGVLFEIATDPPGFAIDEAPQFLGSSLMLPDQYESSRGVIAKSLPDLNPHGLEHVFKAAPEESDDGGTIVALHGTGGTEHDLVDMAGCIAPRAAILSPRGNSLENGMARFFRRLANNVFDETDVVRRAHEMADFLIHAMTRYDRRSDTLTAFGYSNGANIAAAVLQVRPEIFSAAVLVRPMLPLPHLLLPDLQDKPVLILGGAHDRIIPAESTHQLANLLAKAGADVQVHTLDTGHRITKEDIAIASRWLSGGAAATPQTVAATI